MSFPTVTADIPGHGSFTPTAASVDLAIERYLPASPRQLQALVTERTGIDYSDVHEVSALLIVLADTEG